MSRSTIHCFYRLSPNPVAPGKIKLPGLSKEASFHNFCSVFSESNITVCGDSLDDSLRAMVNGANISMIEINEGSGGANFRASASRAMDLPGDSIVYLVEDDFLHRPGATHAIMDGINLGIPYVTLYDHPDKYLAPESGGNPRVKGGGEPTRLLCGEYCHWKVTNSTVMTFATTSAQLRLDWKIFLKYCGGKYTDDYRLFLHLGRKRRSVISSVPGFSTHGEIQWLSPHFDWASLIS